MAFNLGFIIFCLVSLCNTYSFSLQKNILINNQHKNIVTKNVLRTSNIQLKSDFNTYKKNVMITYAATDNAEKMAEFDISG